MPNVAERNELIVISVIDVGNTSRLTEEPQCIFRYTNIGSIPDADMLVL